LNAEQRRLYEAGAAMGQLVLPVCVMAITNRFAKNVDNNSGLALLCARFIVPSLMPGVLALHTHLIMGNSML
jgi:hypothetical protein